jgi:hypothetical protein
LKGILKQYPQVHIVAKEMRKESNKEEHCTHKTIKLCRVRFFAPKNAGVGITIKAVCCPLFMVKFISSPDGEDKGGVIMNFKLQN